MKEKPHNILFKDGFITNHQHKLLDDVENKRIISLFYELRILLYLGVLLFTSGVGFLIYQNVGNTGHYIALTVLVILCGISFNYIISKAGPFSKGNSESPTPYFDYVLLLACLLFVSIQVYLQFLFNVFTDYFSITTLLNSALFFFISYRYNHAGILALGITTFASFLGINVSPQNWINQDFLELKEIYNTGIVLGVFLGIIDIVLNRFKIKPHFSFTYFNFASLIFTSSALSGLFSENIPWLYFPLIILGTLAMIWYAKNKKSFLFLIYAFVFAYIGLTYLFFNYISFHNESVILFWSFYTIASCFGMIYFVKRFKNYYK